MDGGNFVSVAGEFEMQSNLSPPLKANIAAVILALKE